MNTSASNRSPVLLIHPNDNIAVALEPLAAGTAIQVNGRSLTLAADIPAGHKFALRTLAEGEPVMKYGQPMGRATRAIQPGEWVHVHNVRTNLTGTLEYSYAPALTPVSPVHDGLTFDGFLRPGGDVGVRNEIWILPTVGCVNDIAQTLVRRFREQGLPENVDGVHAFTHPFGCSELGEDHVNTQKILAGLACHPNAGGVLVIGLGCENNHIAAFRRALGDDAPRHLRFMAAQESTDEFAEGLHLLGELAREASRAKREPVPLARLRVGLKCGGSDGFSGLTANPLLGVFSDELIRRGGATVLTEVPEMFGAEPLFMNHCLTPEIFAACAKMLNDFKDYFLHHGQPVYENPSAGNKDGGITTLEEKSLGCLQKGGTAPIVDVLQYGGRLTRPGLSLLDGPGNDLVSVTALAAAGVHLILFTTGRGTPFGGPVPTVKVATNSPLAARKPHWIDFDAGRLLRGETMADLARELLQRVIETASGRRLACNEINGCREIAIFKDGVTL